MMLRAVDLHGATPETYARYYHHDEVAAVLATALREWEQRQQARLAAAKRGGWCGCLADVFCCRRPARTPTTTAGLKQE